MHRTVPWESICPIPDSYFLAYLPHVIVSDLQAKFYIRKKCTVHNKEKQGVWDKRLSLEVLLKLQEVEPVDIQNC